jgi:hypothetical protein
MGIQGEVVVVEAVEAAEAAEDMSDSGGAAENATA